MKIGDGGYCTMSPQPSTPNRTQHNPNLSLPQHDRRRARPQTHVARRACNTACDVRDNGMPRTVHQDRMVMRHGTRK